MSDFCWVFLELCFFLFFFFTEKIECNSVEIGEKVGVFSLSLHSLFSFLFSLILCVCVWKEDGSYWGDDRTRWYIHGFFLLLFFVKKYLIFMLNLYWVLYEINSSWILWLWDGVFFFFFFCKQFDFEVWNEFSLTVLPSHYKVLFFLSLNSSSFFFFFWVLVSENFFFFYVNPEDIYNLGGCERRSRPIKGRKQRSSSSNGRWLQEEVWLIFVQFS